MINYSFPNIDLTDQDYTKINDTIKSGWVSMGKHVQEAEELLKERFGVKHAILCNNATNALTIAIKAAGWKELKIAIPSLTWPSTLYSVESSCRKNQVLFSDINKDSWIIEPHPEAEVMIAVDIFGNDSYFKSNLPTIYDAAHGFDLKNVGKRGLAEVISFSFTKVVTAMEGGVVLTNNDDLAEIATELRRLSCRMGEVNAIVLKNSIARYDSFYKNFRLEVIEDYRKKFNFNFTEQAIPIETNYSVYSILFENSLLRNIVSSALTLNHIEHKTYYEPLVLGLPNTDDVFSRILSLPVHEKMIEDQNKIISVINQAVNSGGTPGKIYFYNSGYLNKYLK